MNAALLTVIPAALVTGTDNRLTVIAETKAAIDVLITTTKAITACDATTRPTVIAYREALARVRIDTDKQRKAANDLSQKIIKDNNAVAAALLSPAQDEENRLHDLVADFDLAEDAKRRAAAEEAERLARIESERVAAEWHAAEMRRMEAEKAAADAEAARIAAEQAAAAPAVTVDDEIAAAAALDAHRDWLLSLSPAPPAPPGAARFDEMLRLRGQHVRAIVLLLTYALKDGDQSMTELRARKILQRFVNAGGDTADLSRALVTALNESGVYGPAQAASSPVEDEDSKDDDEDESEEDDADPLEKAPAEEDPASGD
jgi:cyanate lyase